MQDEELELVAMCNGPGPAPERRLTRGRAFAKPGTLMTKDEFDRLLPLKVPHVIAACPICGDVLYIDECSEWIEDVNEQMRIDLECSSIHIDCVTAPDPDSEEWEEWFQGHWSMPYADWLPVEQRVKEWLAEELRNPDILRWLGCG